jgi:hypothetical protein
MNEMSLLHMMLFLWFFISCLVDSVVCEHFFAWHDYDPSLGICWVLCGFILGAPIGMVVWYFFSGFLESYIVMILIMLSIGQTSEAIHWFRTFRW